MIKDVELSTGAWVTMVTQSSDKKKRGSFLTANCQVMSKSPLGGVQRGKSRKECLILESLEKPCLCADKTKWSPFGGLILCDHL